MKARPGTIRSILILSFCSVVAYNQYSTAERIDDLEVALQTLHTEVVIDRIEQWMKGVEPTEAPEPKFTPNKRSADFKIIKTKQRIEHKQLDIFCLAKNIFHEAGIEDDIGKYAVAQVTLNRVANSRYPNTICDVVMQPWQFSWANDRSQRWTHPQGPLWQRSQEIAREVILEGYRLKGLETANYYHADYVQPRWASDDYKITKLGTHVFYAQAARR